MDKQELSKEAKQSLNESKARGEVFQLMIRSKGWEFVKAFYTNRVQSFASGLLMQDKKPIADFEDERRELIGIRKLLGYIDNDIKNLEGETKNEEKNS